ncbi:inositol monophosphatase family protein [Ahrensia kielensis]|uniref:inositol monophosphatase family protein n=1 Tax=Ahrensia kielensis TaxID=76980 RepID=UPI0005A819F9|nr:inositol monophosphatase [Ahrensia kielensis]
MQTKGTQDWVTNVDLEVEALIRNRLGQAYPADVIVGEETAHDPSSGNTAWIIDPIDGTTCFMLGLPQWCVVLTYTVYAEPVVSAIVTLVMDELYHATKGGGAFLNDTPIRVTDATTIGAGLISVGANEHGDPHKSAAFIGKLVADGGMYIRAGACALGLCYVAAGRLLAAYEPKVSPWDDLAGMLLVREAGGQTNAFAQTLASANKRSVLAAAPGIWNAVSPLY